MRISIGADHRGYKLKQELVPWLQSQGYDVADEGPTSTDSVDYPDYALKVANKVSSGQADRGILVCATGVGMCITANKVHGVRATTCGDVDVARLSRQHNDVNVVCLSGDKLDESAAEQILDMWLETEFEGGRHAVRVEKIADIEHEQCQPVV
jgi:ribose 5-phosphate isomerase B